MNTFYIKNGQLSYYGFACGYVEKSNTANSWKELYMEHSHFHVREGKHGEGFTTWETFESNELTKARKFYNSLKINLMNYSNDNIIFENDDTLQIEATKIVHLFSGTYELKKKLTRLKIAYTKVEKGANTSYVLRHKSFGRVVVKL